MVGIKNFTWSWCSVEGSRTSLLIWVVNLKSVVIQVVWGFLYKSLVLSRFTSEVWQGLCTHCLTEISAPKEASSAWGQWALSKPGMNTPLRISWFSFCVIQWCTWNSRNLDMREVQNSWWNLHVKAFSINSTFEIMQFTNMKIILKNYRISKVGKELQNHWVQTVTDPHLVTHPGTLNAMSSLPWTSPGLGTKKVVEQM